MRTGGLMASWLEVSWEIISLSEVGESCVPSEQRMDSGSQTTESRGPSSLATRETFQLTWRSKWSEIQKHLSAIWTLSQLWTVAMQRKSRRILHEKELKRCRYNFEAFFYSFQNLFNPLPGCRAMNHHISSIQLSCPCLPPERSVCWKLIS